MEYKLKPCPFCGADESTFRYRITKDRRKVHGIYYTLYQITCGGCTCTLRQAGATEEAAFENVSHLWTMRYGENARRNE